MARILYFVAGETSGDNHGAALMRALRARDPELHFRGRGGSRMKEIAGAEFLDWSDEAAVVGLWEVIKRYRYFHREFQKTLAEIDAIKPAAVILIDYPGFNLRAARALRRRSLGGKILYYISPQVWAWNRGRIRHMARSLDLMLCIFPFEAELYEKSGLRTKFVGHPMIESLESKRIGGARDPNLIGLFPGSRLREVHKILPVMLQTAGLLASKNSALRFEVAAASPALSREIQMVIHRENLDSLQMQITIGEAAALMQRAQAGLVASGTATLEASCFGLPFVLVYRVAWLTYLAARLLVKSKYLGMPNVIAGREIVPEFIQARARANLIAHAFTPLLTTTETRSAMLTNLREVAATLGEQEASENAAAIILEEISSRG